MIAYHYISSDSKLIDGTIVPPDGEWLVFTGELSIARSGLHASSSPWLALAYAPGSTLCEVECEGVHTTHYTKFVCRRRRILRRVDLADQMRRFALVNALARSSRLCICPKVVLDYLSTCDMSLRQRAWEEAKPLASTPDGEAIWAATWECEWRAARVAALRSDEAIASFNMLAITELEKIPRKA